MPLIKSSEKISVTFTLNGIKLSKNIYPRTLLSDFLRCSIGETGTHVGCEHGICGACTIIFNGKPIRSCLMLAYQVNGHELTTVEGIAKDKNLDDLRAAFKRHHALQCGFCTSGFLITISSYLNENPIYADEKEIRKILSGNICRCTGYVGIVDAVLEVIKKRNENKKNA